MIDLEGIIRRIQNLDQDQLEQLARLIDQLQDRQENPEPAPEQAQAGSGRA